MRKVSLQTRFKPFLVVVLLLLVSAVYYFYPPSKDAFYPACPFNTITGFLCPGCGSQRAVHHLLHWDIKTAFAHNAVFVLLVPYFLLKIVFKVLNLKDRFPFAYRILYGGKTFWLLFVLVIFYGIFRNLN